jgi:hypothetical protein
LQHNQKDGDFRLKGEGIVIPAKSMRIIDYVFQAGITFHRTGVYGGLLSVNVEGSGEMHGFNIHSWMYSDEIAIALKHHTAKVKDDSGTWVTGVPSYSPFLLGIVRSTTSKLVVYAIFINLKLVMLASKSQVDTFPGGTLQLVTSSSIEVSIQHTRLWIPGQ